MDFLSSLQEPANSPRASDGHIGFGFVASAQHPNLRAAVDAAMGDNDGMLPASRVRALQQDVIFQCLEEEASKSYAGWVSIAKAISDYGSVMTTVRASHIWHGGIGNFLDSAEVAGSVGVFNIKLNPTVWNSYHLQEKLVDELDNRQQASDEALARLRDAEESMLLVTVGKEEDE